MNRYSRRKFFKESGCMAAMAAITAGLSSFIPSGAAGGAGALSGAGDSPVARASVGAGDSPVAPASDPDRIRELLQRKAPSIWLFTGDSITAGVEHTHGYRSYPEIFGERIRFEMHRPNDIVINTGISGNILQNILDDFGWRVAQFKPAVVSLMIGTNDCARSELNPETFKGLLKTFLARVRGSGAVPILQTPNIIIADKASGRAQLPAFVAAMQQLAKEEQVILVDNWAYWQDTLQDHPDANVYKNWLNDPLHPNGTGHSEIARLMFKKLSIFDPAAATCGGKYYEGEH